MNNNIIYGSPHISQKSNSGMYFYDQDVAMLRYCYSGSFKIDMNVLYNNPGIGIAISEYKNDNPLDTDNVYIIKLGINSVSIFRRQYAETERIYYKSCGFTIQKNVSQNIIFEMNGNYISVCTVVNKNKVSLCQYTLDKSIDKYYLGFYSNKDNVIINASIYDEKPEWWFTNLKNTNGGRISFSKDTIKIEQCKYASEIEQEKIKLPAGKYYLDYELEDLSGTNDIEAFIFNSTALPINVKDKNLISADNSITIKEDEYFNLLFRGTNGIIKNIAIKDSEDSAYVSTGENTVHKDGSYLEFNLTDLVRIQISGVIKSVPSYELDEQAPYSIIEYGNNKYLLSDCNIELNTDVSFDIDVKNGITKISSGTSLIGLNSTDKLIMFKNINGIINTLLLTYSDGSIINVLVQTTVKKYVTDIINSPILVLDEDENPLDLSASYRLCSLTNKYIFTNWEREYFDTSRHIMLSKKASDTVGSLYIYGIKSDNYDLSMLNTVTDEQSIHSIDLFCSSYDLLTDESYVLNNNISIEFQEGIVEQYKLIVVEYLKPDSYAINHIDNQYELDISTEKTVFTTCYDMTNDGQVRQYKTIDNTPSTDSYIVLAK